MKTNLDAFLVHPCFMMISLIVNYVVLAIVAHINVKVSPFVNKLQKISVLLYAGVPLFLFADDSAPPFWLSIWGAFIYSIIWANQNEIRHWFIFSSMAVFALLCARWGTLYYF